MRRNALPMLEKSYARVLEMLRNNGIIVEPSRDINEFRTLKCSRDEVTVLLAVSKPAHWATASDQRREMVVVAVIGESIFRFWRIAGENRLRREIVELLRPLEWMPNRGGTAPDISAAQPGE
jgi:hypothetical protein